MRASIRKFIELTATTLPIRGSIYEFGAWQPKGQESTADLRGIFPGIEYVGCDMRPGKGVDRVLDLHAIELPDASVATVISCDTFEHVEYPRQAIAEIHRILDPLGMLIITSVMNFPIHEYPHDYWRFTPEGLRSLLKPFASSFIGSFGDEPEHPQTVVGIGFKGDPPELEEFERGYRHWQQRANEIMRKLRAESESLSPK
ncbi:MAG: methyltransferase domain-containing protein [Gammaproteobacteria bacterium]|nr:methyltransferase domain-containing protein [Gammaproteobacteria bacterium]